MLGLLSFSEKTSLLEITLPHHSHLTLPKDVVEANIHFPPEHRLHDCMRWLPPELHSNYDVLGLAMTLHMISKPDIQEFAVRSLSLHHTLPTEEQAHRDQLFQAIWDAYHPDTLPESKRPSQCALAQLVARTYPTELIQSWTRATCYQLWTTCSMWAKDGLPDAPPIATINKRIRLNAMAQPRLRILIDLVFSRGKQEMPRFVDMICQMELRDLQDRLEALENVRAHADRTGLGEMFWRVDLSDAWVMCCEEAPRAQLPAFSRGLQRRALEMQDRLAARTSRMARATVQAVRSGVDLGKRWTTQSRDAIRRFDERQRQQTQAWSQALRESVTQEAGTASDAAPAAEQEAIHAWGIDRLVRWINGPVTAPDTRSAMLQTKRPPASGQAPAPTPSSNAPKQAPVEDSIAIDAPLLVPIALRDTARFLLGELQDLSALAVRLRLSDVIDPWLVGCAPQLKAVATASSDAGADIDLLTRIDQALDGLRQRLRQVQAQAQLSAQFEEALAQALRDEQLVLGKRRGGVIGCPLPAHQWGAVHDRYHQRLLTRCDRVGMPSGAWALGADQALALYVTGSSQSGHAFDISVHLWARRQGRTTPPSRDNGSYPRMNTDDWFDTYQPCCVLHVPLGQ